MSHSEILSSFNISEPLLDKDKVAAVHKAVEVDKVHLHCMVVGDIPFLVGEDLVVDKAVVEGTAYLHLVGLAHTVLADTAEDTAHQEVDSTLQVEVGIRLEVAAELLWFALGVYPLKFYETSFVNAYK